MIDWIFFAALWLSIIGMAVGVYLRIPKAPKPQTSEKYWSEFNRKWHS